MNSLHQNKEKMFLMKVNVELLGYLPVCVCVWTNSNMLMPIGVKMIHTIPYVIKTVENDIIIRSKMLIVKLRHLGTLCTKDVSC